MTPDQFAALVRPICAKLKPGEYISSTELAQRVAPPVGENWGRDRSEFFKDLASARHRSAVAENWTQGPAMTETRFGREVVKRPFLWHLPKVRCPHCAGTGYIEEQF